MKFWATEYMKTAAPAIRKVVARKMDPARSAKVDAWKETPEGAAHFADAKAKADAIRAKGGKPPATKIPAQAFR